MVASTTMMTEEQVKELAALVEWLNTFDTFGFQIGDAEKVVKNPDRVIEELSSSEVTRAISKIAEQICESPVDSSQQHSGGHGGSSDRIWTALLMLTSTRARPIPKDPSSNNENDGARMNPARLRLYVLSNLLDCAVQSPNMHRRRQYIERIMGLDKLTQKILMSLIERRTSIQKGGGSSSKSKRSPPRSGRTKSPMPSRASLQQKRSLFESPSAASEMDTGHSGGGGGNPAAPINTPKASHRRRASFSSSSNNNNKSRSTPTTTTPSIPKVDSMASTTIASNTATTPSAYTPKTPRSRNLTIAFDSPTTGYTPEPKRSYNTNNKKKTNRPTPSNTNNMDGSMLLSPGTLESPNQVQSIVRDLKGRNAKFENILDTYRHRESELKGKLEEHEAVHRQEMIKLESKSMDREQEIVQQYNACIDDLKQDLKVAQEKAAQGEQAVQELQKARDELEVLQQSKNSLSTTAEQLRKFKERVQDLQDVKDALAREQEAHGKSVDEIVRLENELKSLLPLKRQLEDYKIRAIEAEVKLVECQDCLRRLEQQANMTTESNQTLRQGAMLQKEQLEELQRRIQQETSAKPSEAGGGVGEGWTELNPQLKEELLRLRNENVQLRAFAEKRTNDAVQKMSESLDDYKRLAERYKNEFLSTKNKLEETHGELTESEDRNKALTAKVQEWKDRAEQSERMVTNLQAKLQDVTGQLEQTQANLEAVERRNSELRSDVNSWMSKFNEAETMSTKQKSTIQELKQNLETTQSALGSSEGRVHELREHNAACEEKLERMAQTQEEMEGQLEQTDDKLNTTRGELEASRKRAGSLQEKVQSLQDETEQLKEQVEEERQAKQDAMEEAHSSLEATREVLQAKAKKDMEELQNNMNHLLEDERKNSRQKQEDANARLRSADQRWKRDYTELQERSASSLKHSREEAQDRLDNLKQECNRELAKTRKQAEEARENLVTRGKAMIAEAKEGFKKEMQAICDEKKNVEDKLAMALQENEEVEQLLKSKISSLKNKLEYAVGQNNGLTEENDELQEQIQLLERDRFKMQEENDRFRQQLRGRFGSDEKLQGQLEKLQKEFNAVLEENRDLKKAARYQSSSGMLGAISESDLSDMSSTLGGSAYGRGEMNKEFLESRLEYEDMIKKLNDEKRELVMKNASSATDVEKAERRAWEAEQATERLKEELTSTQLALQRTQMSFDENDEEDNSNKSHERYDHESRYSRSQQQHDDERNRSYHNSSSPPPGSSRQSSYSSASRRSPSIDQAMREKAERDSALHSKLRSFAQGSPSRLHVGTTQQGQASEENRVLSPTRKHEESANRSSDTFGLGVNSSASKRTEALSSSHKADYNYGSQFSDSNKRSSSDVYGLGLSSQRNSPYKSSSDVYGLGLSNQRNNSPYKSNSDNGGEQNSSDVYGLVQSNQQNNSPYNSSDADKVQTFMDHTRVGEMDADRPAECSQS